MFTITDNEGGTLATTRSGEVIARAIKRGEIARTGSPLVFRLTRKAAERPAGAGLSPIAKRRAILRAQRS